MSREGFASFRSDFSWPQHQEPHFPGTISEGQGQVCTQTIAKRWKQMIRQFIIASSKGNYYEHFGIFPSQILLYRILITFHVN